MIKKLMILSAILSVSSNASEILNVKATRTMMDLSYGEKVFIQVNGNPSRDNCHTNSIWDYVLFTDTEVGKQMLSQVLTAYSADKR